MMGATLDTAKGLIVGCCLISASARAESYFAVAYLGMEPAANYGSHARGPAVPTLTAGEIAEALKLGGFPIAAIADMGGVERKTIYSWLEGVQAQSAREERMRVIYQTLKNATGGDYRQLYRVWKQKDGTGTTLRDLLIAEDLDVAAIQARVEGLRESMAYYDRMEARRGPTLGGGRGNPVIDESPGADLG